MGELIRQSKRVIAGNAFLADYALRLNPHTVTIPTPLNTEVFSVKDSHGTSDRCIIGWVGSHSTAKYLRVLNPVLERLTHTHCFTLKVVGAGNPVRVPGVEVISLPWSLQREPEEFRTCDIGVYPLWDDEWAKGKCGFKAIQFMACGVPVVASAVGVNAEIIQDGVTGFLARSNDEWGEKLSLLIQDALLRQELGLAGRQVVEERFSLRANEGKFLAAIEAAVGQ